MFSVIGRGKSTQARATLPAEIFEEFIFESSSSSSQRHGGSNGGSVSAAPVLHFCINLSTLLDCLHLFGSTSETTAATLTYSVGVKGRKRGISDHLPILHYTWYRLHRVLLCVCMSLHYRTWMRSLKSPWRRPVCSQPATSPLWSAMTSRQGLLQLRYDLPAHVCASVGGCSL